MTWQRDRGRAEERGKDSATRPNLNASELTPQTATKPTLKLAAHNQNLAAETPWSLAAQTCRLGCLGASTHLQPQRQPSSLCGPQRSITTPCAKACCACQFAVLAVLSCCFVWSCMPRVKHMPSQQKSMSKPCKNHENIGNHKNRSKNSCQNGWQRLSSQHAKLMRKLQ